MSCLIYFSFLFHQISDPTHNALNECNLIQANVLGLVLDSTFSCSFQNLFWYIEIIPPLKLSQYEHKWKHTCKLEVGGHNETSSFFHIYPLFLIVLSHIFRFITFWWFNYKNFQHIYHLYLIIIIFIIQFFSLFIYW